MVATVNISAAVQIDPLYSSGGANVHSHLINGSLGLLGRYLDRFSRFLNSSIVYSTRKKPCA